MDRRPQVLLIRLKALGDIVFTLPAAHCIREAFPQARITFLVSKEYAPLLEGFPQVDAILPLDRGRYRGFHLKEILAETLRVLSALRQGRFGLVVDFQGYGETALLTWCSGAAQRWGTLYRPARRWAYTCAVNREDHLHPIEKNLAFLRQAGLPVCAVVNQFQLPPTALDSARNLFAGLGLSPGRPTLFIQPFSSSPHKDWPLEGYLALARRWRERGVQILFGGGPAERPALVPVRQAGFAVAAGAPLLLSAGLATLSTLVLGGDTGLLHLAAAMAKPVVMILGSTSPGACFPFGWKHLAVVPPPGAPVSTVSLHAVERACAGGLSALEKGLESPGLFPCL